MKKNIVVIITTKNRTELLKKAITSVNNQSVKPLITIVVSDSTLENKVIEKEILDDYDVILLDDKYTNNYAGSLNTAIDYLVMKIFVEKSISNENLFVAFLDDDDSWNQDYLYECLKVVDQNTDIVISGLIYENDDKRFPLEIPQKLSYDSFLAKNPHIQGSNTFVKLSTLLMAGCFDENMSSTTDRDIFTRLLMLSPYCKIVNKHLVYIDAKTDRERLTIIPDNKKDSLSNFYSKYAGLMDNVVEKNFFDRTNRFSPLTKEKVEEYLSKDFCVKRKLDKLDSFDNRIVYGVISGSFELSKRIIDNLSNQMYQNIKLVLLQNFEKQKNETYDYAIYKGIRNIIIYDVNDSKKIIEYIPSKEYLKKSKITNKINDIATSRTILNYLLKINIVENDIIWIIDDDMEFSSIIKNEGDFEKVNIELKDICAKYKGQFDAVVGSYSLQPPLPLFSTLRTKLLDYVYSTKLNKNNIYDYSIMKQADYYYDLTVTGHKHLETPLKCDNVMLNDIFEGDSTSRPLFEYEESIFTPISRGGNTIIYNHELLDIPNISIVFGNTVARRSDYFWVKVAIEEGYKIVGTSFSMLHNRPKQEFNYENERDKSIKDLLGSSFVKSYNSQDSSRTHFREKFICNLNNRLVRFIDSYFRIIGLLKIAGEGDYGFNLDNLNDYIRRVNQFVNPSKIEASFDLLMGQVNKYKKYRLVPNIKTLLSNKLGKEVNFIGNGQEGAVFSDGDFVYKVLFDNYDLSYLLKINDNINNCEELSYIELLNISNHPIIKYKYYTDIKPYDGGYVREIVNLINYLKHHNLVLTNIKRDNFIIANEKLKFIDYGKNIEPYTTKKYEMSVERAYEMLRYPDLSISEYKEIISLSHKGQTNNICFGIENFKLLLKNRNKEQIHDQMIINEIKRLSPTNILDYGAGKCKIANSLIEDYNFDVFDIDTKIISERADKAIGIVKDIDSVNKKHDLIISNLVLCCVNDDVAEDIVEKISNLLDENGNALISFCNPFFTDIENTESKELCRQSNYYTNSKWIKKTKYGLRDEYHRPITYYINLFSKNGLKIEKIEMVDGVDFDNLEPISEHILFTLKKKNKIKLGDCSLLIKCNPMEYQHIYEDILNIVLSLEKNCSFAEKIVLVDSYENSNRNRKYSDDNKDELIRKIELLKNNRIIDKIIIFDKHNEKTYKKWFGKDLDNPYSSNGQQLEATLYGFDYIKTKYVFQTDSDIIYVNKNSNFSYYFDCFKKSNAITGSLSILHDDVKDDFYGKRTEVRSCFINLQSLNELLPLENNVVDNSFEFAWHRSLDNKIKFKDSIRFYSNDLMFIHPNNNIKTKDNIIYPIKSFIEQDYKINQLQMNNVELIDDIKQWVPKTDDNLVLFIRGINYSCSKLLRLFNSLKRQTLTNYSIIYIDDASNNETVDFAKVVFKYDSFFKDKVISVFNSTNIGSLANFEFAMKNIAINPNSIIVNIDSDDALIRNDSLEIILNEFIKGADVTVGNCFRADKPMKHYEVFSFKESWKRDGDNIWLHPKCFKRVLVNYCLNNFKYKDKYLDVATDYAMMLPIVAHAKNPVFIDKQLYYFEPSDFNKHKINNYDPSWYNEVINELFSRAKKDYERKTISIIGDANPSEENYLLAKKIGTKLIDLGYKVKTGGLGGIMEASLKGAKMSKFYTFGDTIGILPSLDENEANEYVDIAIPTGLDISRNSEVIDSDAIIIIGGGAGTLSEIAFAWQRFKMIIAMKDSGGWADKVANTKLDNRVRYENIPEDKIYSASSLNDLECILNKYIDIYVRKHNRIKWRNK